MLIFMSRKRQRAREMQRRQNERWEGGSKNDFNSNGHGGSVAFSQTDGS